ncbi:hypothetical protein YSY43_08270 [Paenibacillus sp. YSY-4.3]
MNIWPKSCREPDLLKRRLYALSALDIIICPEEWLRRYRFYPRWKGEVTLASISNGAGDDLYIVFAPEGTLIKGFDHESVISPYVNDDGEVWPGIYEGVPASLLNCLDDESLCKEDVTFCLWREQGDRVWKCGVSEPQGLNDGSDFLLGMIYETPYDYVEWAQYYYDLEVLDIDVVRRVFDGFQISEEMINKLNPTRNTKSAVEEINEIGTFPGK